MTSLVTSRQVRDRFLKESAFEDITLEAERKRIFKDFMHVLEVVCVPQGKQKDAIVLDLLLLLCCFLFSMNANITIPRQRNTPRSPRNTTGNDPALDRSVVPREEEVTSL